MRNPFPGLNPYLEQAELWHQVHNRLIIAIADTLTPQIAPPYRIAIEEEKRGAPCPVKGPMPEVVIERENYPGAINRQIQSQKLQPFVVR